MPALMARRLVLIYHRPVDKIFVVVAENIITVTLINT